MNQTDERVTGGVRRSRREREAGTLAQHALTELKDRILSCELSPGRIVVSHELAGQLGMTKAPVNEALKMLCGEGLLQSVPRVGYVVAPLTLNDVESTFDLRLLLEPHAVDLAMRHATARQIEGFVRGESNTVLDEVFSAESSRRGREALLKRAELHDEFHLRVASLSGNPRLIEVIRGLLYSSRRVKLLVYRHSPDGERMASPKPTMQQMVTAQNIAPSHHVALGNAIVSGDRDAAIEHMTTHIQKAKRDVLSRLAEARLVGSPRLSSDH